MEFQKVAQKVGFSTAVALQYEQLKENPAFWDSLTLVDWLSIYFCDILPLEVKVRAVTEIEKMATTFSDLRRVANYYSEETALSARAWQKMEQMAETFEQNAVIARKTMRYDFDKLLLLAETFDDLVAFCGIVTSIVTGRNDRDRLVKAALDKISSLAGIDCRKWVDTYLTAITDGVRRLAFAKIQEFDLPTSGWLSFPIRCSGSGDLPGLVFEKSLASARSFGDCSLIWQSSVNSYGRDKIYEKALSFAETMGQLSEIASINNHKQPLASKIVEKMAQIAATFDDWRAVHFYSRGDNPLHAKAFEEMKKLAAA
jgi:hypothetical protein